MDWLVQSQGVAVEDSCGLKWTRVVNSPYSCHMVLHLDISLSISHTHTHTHTHTHRGGGDPGSTSCHTLYHTQLATGHTHTQMESRWLVQCVVLLLAETTSL